MNRALWRIRHSNHLSRVRQPKSGSAASPELEGFGGVYCEDCNISEMAPEDGGFYGVKPYAIDAEQAERLWALSAELTNTDIPVSGRE